MSVATELERIQKAKNDIKTSIINKGVAVDEAATIDTYASKIDAIPLGGPGNAMFGEIGYTDNDPIIMAMNRNIAYSKQKAAGWDPSRTTGTGYFDNDQELVFAPLVDTKNVIDMTKMFWGSRSLVSVPALDTSSVTSMSYMFSGCNNIKFVPAFDTGKVKDMSYMFAFCQNLLALPQLDTSSVTNMDSFLQNCELLTAFNTYDTSKVENMNSMFYECYSLKEVKLNTSSVKKMTWTFKNNNILEVLELTGGMPADCSCLETFKMSYKYGTLKLHVGGAITRSSYDPIIKALPQDWKIEEISDL